MRRSPLLLLPSLFLWRCCCCRSLASDEYYPALCQPNVQVVTSAVKEVRHHATAYPFVLMQ
jgi:hypothetical protein